MVAEGFPVEPFSDIVIAEQIKEEVLPSGIVLPGNEANTRWARVHAVGPGRMYSSAMNATGTEAAVTFVPTVVRPGDLVCFDAYQTGGKPLKLDDGKEYLLFREGDLIGRKVAKG